MALNTTPAFYLKIKTRSTGLVFDMKKTKIITELTYSDSPDSLAKQMDFTVVDAMYKGKRLRSYISPRDKVTLYADMGKGKKEVFAGVIWEKTAESGTEKEISFTAYDYLIYCMKSEDYFFYRKGLQTSEIMKKICSAWGLSLKYTYGSIKHPRIKPVQNTIGDMMVYVLNKAKKETGKRYVLTVKGTTVIVKYAGKNKNIYTLEKEKNVISASKKDTMEDMVTKVKIYGEETKRSVPKLAVVKKNTGKYGTMQMVEQKEKKQKLSQIRKKANKTLKSKAKLQHERTITAVSNPLIKRGDKVYVKAEVMKGYRIVKSISHDCVEGTMDVEFY